MIRRPRLAAARPRFRSAAARVARRRLAGGAARARRRRPVGGARHRGEGAAPRATSPARRPPGTTALLAAASVGAWARPALLELDPSLSLEIAEEAPSADDTVRLALRARDGALVETVIIPGPSRATLCVSSQVGCARACTFCETGRHGLDRQLEAGEIVDQVRIARARWRAGEARRRSPTWCSWAWASPSTTSAR